MPLNPKNTGENQLQAINQRADAIERDTGIAVVRCHLGSPMGPEFERTNQLLSQHYARRGGDPESRGYVQVVGREDIRGNIALALGKINRLPKGTLSAKNIVGAVGGTGALNVALSLFNDPKKPAPTVLVSDPYYPPWENITERVHNHYETFPLRREDSYLLNKDILSEKIRAINAKNPDSDVILLYHYPHNPTGKTLTEAEATEVGKTLNALCHEFPNLRLLQEDAYLATVAPELGIYTPLPYLDEHAKNNTILVHSPSKMGHQRDRGGIVAVFNDELWLHTRGATSADSLGTPTASIMATANTLMHIAQGGVDAIGAEGSYADNHRFVTARYYQDRIKALYAGFKEIEDATGEKLLEDGIPQGAYYLYPSFDLLKGKAIPEELLPAFNGKTIFENADDVTCALENAHLLGLRPVTVASGTLFTRDPNTMNIRFSTIDPKIENLHDAANTIKGLVGKTLRTDKLYAHFACFDAIRELQTQYPAQTGKPKKPRYRLYTRDNGSTEWGMAP